jgi:hypothetical protein
MTRNSANSDAMIGAILMLSVAFTAGALCGALAMLWAFQ